MARGKKFERGFGNRWEDRRLQESLAKPLDQLSDLHFIEGARLEDIELSAGDNKIAHKLQRVPLGYHIEKYEGDFGTSSVSTDSSGIKLRQWKYFNHSKSGSPASVTVSLDQAPEDDSTLVLIHLGDAPGTASGIATITQTGASWYEEQSAEVSGNVRAYLWHAQAVSSAGTSITVTAGGTANIVGGMWIGEFTGVVTTGDPWEISQGTTASTATAYYKLTAMDIAGVKRYVIGGIVDKDALTNTGPYRFAGGGLEALTASNADTRNCTIYHNPNASASTGAIEAGDGGVADDTYVWRENVVGTEEIAYVAGALQPASTGGGASTVTVPHGVRFVSADNRFITLNSISDVAVTMWVF